MTILMYLTALLFLLFGSIKRVTGTCCFCPLHRICAGSSKAQHRRYKNHDYFSRQYDPFASTATISSPTMKPATAISSTAAVIFDTARVVTGLPRATVISAAIAATLFVSALGGLFVEHQQSQPKSDTRKGWKQFLPPSILVTLLTSTTAVYITRRLMSFHIPQQHFFYDLCWSTVLPSSLTLLLFSLPTSSSNNAIQHHSKSSTAVAAYVQQQRQQSALVTIQRLAVPFLIASIGSIIGCFLSFLMCYFNPEKLLSVPEARQAAACLCASFVGGSINFFATSVIIQEHYIRSSSTTGSSHGLLSAMAAVDIVVMAIYFALLSAALQSQRLHRWFSSSKSLDNSSDDEAVDDEAEAPTTKDGVDGTKLSVVHPTIARLIPAVISIGALSLGLVEVSKHMEFIMLKRFGIPGTACAYLAMLVPWITKRINKVFVDYPLWNVMQQCAEPMSRLAFLLVFATMGCTADLATALHNGPACLLVSFTAISIHGIVTFFGSFLFRRLLITKSSKGFDLTDVLIASNAAIGGPATAAAFCGEIKKSLNPIEKRNITIAATVWGVVGYAIGTTIGVTMFRILQSIG